MRHFLLFTLFTFPFLTYGQDASITAFNWGCVNPFAIRYVQAESPTGTLCYESDRLSPNANALFWDPSRPGWVQMNGIIECQDVVSITPNFLWFFGNASNTGNIVADINGVIIPGTDVRCVARNMPFVPTTGQWGLLIIGLMLMIVGVQAVRKHSPLTT